MSHYYTHYWNNETCNYQEGAPGKTLEHTAGNMFRSHGVVAGDTVYVVTVRQGILFLIGKMQVAKICNQDEADKLLGTGLWEAEEHVIAVSGTGSLENLYRRVSGDVTKALRFYSSTTGSPTPLKYAKNNEKLLDQQTLRGIRRLTPSSAMALAKILAEEVAATKG